MLRFMLLAVLACPPTKIENVTKTPWTEHDQKVFDRIKVNFCEVRYKEENCIVLFRKVGEDTYYVLCGKPTEKK